MWLRRIGLTAFAVDRRRGLLAGLDRPRYEVAEVPGEAFHDRGGVQDPDLSRSRGDRPGIPDLTPTLRVEGCPVEEDLDQADALGRLLAVDIGERAVDRARQGGEDTRLRRQFRRTRETRSVRTRTGSQLQAAATSSAVRAPARPASRARRRCSSIASSKPALSTSNPPLPSDLLGQVDREAEGVVQAEGDGSTHV